MRKTACRKSSRGSKIRAPADPSLLLTVEQQRALQAEKLRNLLNCTATDGDRRFENWPGFAPSKG